MERYCGILKRALKSRRHPWRNLDHYVHQTACLTQLRFKYTLDEELGYKVDSDNLKNGERTFPDYPLSILGSPLNKNYKPTTEEWHEIAKLINNQLKTHLRSVKNELSRSFSTIPSWGRVRIAEGGDSIRCLSHENKTGERDASCVRYAPQENVVAYGQLQRILQCSLPQANFWENLSGKTLLLAVITPFRTNGKDATIELTTYRRVNAPVVLDIRHIENVVGRIHTGNQWAIVDRSDGLAKTIFTVDEHEVVPNHDEDDDSDV
ncbi:hypothetical protein K474DRAFT_1737601 [Panus rudis PR-1116 ss-1]|nr:hypothetical protein K474DRAFT_1737601 [Panus rudis PR-1116 ss-1]